MATFFDGGSHCRAKARPTVLWPHLRYSESSKHLYELAPASEKRVHPQGRVRTINTVHLKRTDHFRSISRFPSRIKRLKER